MSAQKPAISSVDNFPWAADRPRVLNGGPVGLLALANEMLGYARHWEDLKDPDRAAAFHQAAAAYVLAAVREL